MNARQVAARLGVSERWVRDHTTRRSPRIRGLKFGSLVRYRWADVEAFLDELDTQRTSRPSQIWCMKEVFSTTRDQKQKRRTNMAMKYQKGTVYLCGEKVKMWYGKYLIYEKDQEGKEIRKHRNVSICPKADTPKWKAEQLFREIILKEVDSPGIAEGACC